MAYKVCEVPVGAKFRVVLPTGLRSPCQCVFERLAFDGASVPVRRVEECAFGEMVNAGGAHVFYPVSHFGLEFEGELYLSSSTATSYDPLAHALEEAFDADPVA